MKFDLTALTTPTLRELTAELVSVRNWYSLGVNLGLPSYDLHQIRENYHGDPDHCKTEVLDHWLQSVKLPTWKAVADALHHMGENTVALKMKTKYCSSSPSTGMCPFICSSLLTQG